MVFERYNSISIFITNQQSLSFHQGSDEMRGAILTKQNVRMHDFIRALKEKKTIKK